MLVVIAGTFSRATLRTSRSRSPTNSAANARRHDVSSACRCGQAKHAFHQVEAVAGTAETARTARCRPRDLRLLVVRPLRPCCCGTFNPASNCRPGRFGERAPTFAGDAAVACRGSRWRSAPRRCASVVRTFLACAAVFACCRGLKRMLGPELPVLIVTVLFLGLLTRAGKAVPFAICGAGGRLSADAGWFHGTQRPRLMSWGSNEHIRSHRRALFMFMADILSVSGLEQSNLPTACQAWLAPLPGGCCQTNIAGCAISPRSADRAIATAPRSAASRCASSPAATTTAHFAARFAAAAQRSAF